MDRGTLRALAAMYRQLRRAFRLASRLGEWWRATNGILQGCPLSVVLINLLTSIWKMEIDDMCKHVVVATRRLPPRNVGPPLPGMPSALEPQGAGMAAVCPTRYADDTQAITPAPAAAPMAEAQAVTDCTEVWMADTGQSGNAAKSTSWLLREPPGGVAPLTLGGVAIPLSREFKQLGVGLRLAAEKGTGPVLRGCLDKGLAIMRWVGCLPTFHMRQAALGALANSVALYGVELADIEGRTLSAADTAAAKAIWGRMRCSRAKEVLWGVLARGFHVLPLWCTIPAPALARPPGMHAGHHADLGAGGARVSRPAALHGARGQGLAGRRPAGLAATRRLGALGCAGTADPPALGLGR